MIYTLAILKGGNSKTTSVGALAELAQRHGKRTLLIDLDSQCNLSFWYGADLERAGSYEVITGSATAAQAIQTVRGGLSMISGSANLAGLKTSRSSARRLADALDDVKQKYNAIFIDTGPAMNEALYNGLTAANRILIPLEADTNSLQAFYQLNDVISAIREDRPTIRITGAFVTKYDGRPTINRVVRDRIESACSAAGIPYLGEIRASVCVRESQALQRPLYEYAPRSKPAADYEALYERIMNAK